MHLSAAVFEDILAYVRSESRGGKESRSMPRIGLTATVDVQLLTDSSRAIRARVRDICADGMGMIMNRPLAQSERFLVTLPRVGGPALMLVCEARHCEKVADGIFSIGVHFVEEREDRMPKPRQSRRTIRV